MDTDNFLQQEQARAEIHNQLSAMFAQPDIKVLSSPEMMDSLKYRLGLLLSGSDKVAYQLKESLSKYNETELLIEYSRLFVGPFKIPTPPYSSVYLGDGTVMNDHTMWVLQQYRDVGIDFDFDVHDLPDHIAVENSFLYFLIFHQLQGMQEKNEEKANHYFKAQRDFIEKHYSVWVQKFCEKGIESTKNEFYKALFEIQAKMAALQISPSLPEDF